MHGRSELTESTCNEHLSLTRRSPSKNTALISVCALPSTCFTPHPRLSLTSQDSPV